MPNNIKTSPIINWADLKCICCCGNIGTGKTATCYTILQNINKTQYIYNHPNPSILSETKIQNLNEMNFDKIVDCVLYIDEPQLSIVDTKDKKGLLRLFTLARQRDINIVFSTSDTRWVTKDMESYVDCWIIKDVNYKTVKQGSLIKEIIKEYCNNIMPHHFRLPNNEALLYCRQQLSNPIKITIPLPKHWNEDFSKPYKRSLFNDEKNIFNTHI